MAKGSGEAQSYVPDTVSTLYIHDACVHQPNDDGNPRVRKHINPQWKKKKNTVKKRKIHDFL